MSTAEDKHALKFAALDSSWSCPCPCTPDCGPSGSSFIQPSRAATCQDTILSSWSTAPTSRRPRTLAGTQRNHHRLYLKHRRSFYNPLKLCRANVRKFAHTSVITTPPTPPPPKSHRGRLHLPNNKDTFISVSTLILSILVLIYKTLVQSA